MKVRIGDVCKYRKEFFQIDDEKEYTQITVKLHRKGIVLRKRIIGKDIRTKRQRLCKANDFIVAEMDAKFGGYGIIPEELDGSIVSSHYYLYEIDKTKLLPDFFKFIIQANLIQEQIKAVGSTNYSRVSYKEVLEYEIPCPDINIQRKIVQSLSRVKNIHFELDNEIQTQQTLLKKLRQSILQEAIEGKLTADWRAAHSDVELASALLEKIRAEKERLVKEKKIKKQKHLPPIEEGEVPFEIPESWEWCGLGSIGYALRGKSPKYDKDSSSYAINQKCVRWGYLDLSHSKGIKIDWFESIDKFILTKKGDVLVNSTGEGTIGRSAIVKKREEYNLIYDSHVLLFRTIISESKYVMEFINSDFGQKQIDDSKGAKSTKQTELGVEKLRSLKMPFPPLEEQKEIVKKIENLFTLCDALEAQIDQSKTNSEELMQAVLREAFEPKQTMEKIGDNEKAMTAMSYIIDNTESEKLGRVKLQKILYMYSVANNEYFGFNYKNKHAMGPHDKVRMDTIEAKIEEAKWFKKVRTGEGERSRFDYVPLSNKNDYKKFLSQLPNKKELDRIINLMRPLDLARSEVIATLYAVWKEETTLFGVVDDSIIIGKAKEWHQNKKKYTNDHWKWGMKWLRYNGFIE